MVSRIISRLILGAALAATTLPSALGAQDTPVGFVTHPEWGHLEDLANLPATAELANVFAWRMKRSLQPTDKVTMDDIQVDFRVPEDWLKTLYASERTAYPILDTGVHHSDIPWRAAMTERAGENLLDAQGKAHPWSSLHSPIFRKSSLYYSDQLINWVKQNDTKHRIPGYLMGAEWFWPWGSMDYSPLAVNAFHDWLRRRYRTIDGLNSAWGASYKDWNDIQPPRPTPIGSYDVGLVTFSFGGGLDFAWVRPNVPVKGGHEYSLTVKAVPKRVPEGLCTVEIAWFDKDSKYVSSSYSALLETTRPQNLITLSAEAPANAACGNILLKLQGPGEVTFSDPQFSDAVGGRNLLSDGSDWQLAQYAGKARGKVRGAEGKNPAFTITCDSPEFPFANSGVAFEDWVVFSYESMASWLNQCAEHTKSLDPSRKAISYVGFVFGSHSMWELGVTEQRFDISLANTPALDVNGFQMAIAGSDFTYATFLLDMARKYHKPMWCTDLVDFPYGLFSGFEPIYRGSLACVQHGMTGFFYYNWYGTPDYSFSELMAKPDLERMLRDTRSTIDELKDSPVDTQVAMLCPIQSYSLADEGGFKGDMLECGGLYHLILDLGLTPDVWTPYELARSGDEALRKYRVLFVPDCPILSPEVNKALTKFVCSGGVIIGTGRSPQKDFAGHQLSESLMKGASTPRKDSVPRAYLGSGQVVWIPDKIGRAYWGNVHRTRVFGNTPPLPVEIPDPARTPAARRALRTMLSALMRSAEVQPAIALDPTTENVNMTIHSSGRAGVRKLVLVHSGKGRTHGVTLLMDKRFAGRSYEAWTDLDRRIPVSVDESGKAQLPSFAHSCIVTITTD